MKKNATLYLVVGLVIVVSLAILVFGVFFLNNKDPRETFLAYYLRFSQVSTLNQDDPVKVNGVKLGKVESIGLHKNGVLVRISLRNDVQIPIDSDIRVQNIGLLGERQIGVLLGDSSKMYSAGDTIIGNFDAGIAEVMGMAGEVLDSARLVMNIAHEMLDSTIATPDFKNRFNRILEKAESLEDQANYLMQRIDPALQSSLHSLSSATRKVNEILDENRAPLQGLMADASGLAGNTNSLVNSADSAVQRLLAITRKLESRNNTLGILLNDKKLYEELSTTVNSADSLFRLIIKDGLDVKLSFF
ncbi:MAG: MlaD family protein [Fibromonadaceae bacterium]|jgi:phospholipid/cholesterol/gamma-HCH transport system substrate-binding protein|nr:MlaD family protein [Fibromonadaceae bacterium]